VFSGRLFDSPLFFFMKDFARKIAIHIRGANKGDDDVLPTLLPENTSVPAALAPVPPPPPRTKPLIPKKPIVIEGITMSALQVAYFCMEMGIENTMPTYAGGLGILAGDMLRSAADLEVPTIGITLLHRKGYFKQDIDETGWQHESEELWNPHEKLVLLPQQIMLELEGRVVYVRAWLYKLKGIKGNLNPIIFLDTDCESNAEEDRRITDYLYGGDQRHRILQEAVLGVGGVRMLNALGAAHIQKFHMNEGHSALLTIELYCTYQHTDNPIEEVRRRAVFTTHTPAAVGHDQFDAGLVAGVLGGAFIPEQIRGMVFEGNVLNMTRLGFQMSHYINGVAKKHGEVTHAMFPGYQIESITNGAHAVHWVSDPFARLFDKYLPSWRTDPYSLRYALSIPGEELWRTHEEVKRTLIDFVNERYKVDMNPELLTIGFARRATAYKRGNMLFSDIERLKNIASRSKGIQIIYGGKAHPNDRDGKLLIQQIIANMKHVAPEIKCVYVENYDMEMAKLLVSGVDLWLNTPTRPQEASGTSGMKAAFNGVPQFSVLDGWWLEGHIENVTGWSIGPHPEHGQSENGNEDIEDLYRKLEYIIIPRFENERDQWVKMMRSAIAINGSFFNTHRMVEQYVLSAYFK